MISMYFGVPGVGKTTLLAKIAMEQRKNYQHIYSNVHLKIDGITYIDDDCIGRFELENCLILIDEASIFADNRDYKKFNQNGTRLEYFLTHRHHHADIILFTQGYNAVDKKLRTLTVNLYYMTKKGILGHWFTKYYPISYGIAFPDGERLGEIAEGYSQPPFLVRLFTTKRVFRPKYYKYFDSWAINRLPDLPEEYQPYFDSKTAVKKKGGIIGKIKKAISQRRKKSGTNKSKGFQAADLSGQSYSPESLLQYSDDISGEYDFLRTSETNGTGELLISDRKNAHSFFDLS